MNSIIKTLGNTMMAVLLGAGIHASANQNDVSDILRVWDKNGVVVASVSCTEADEQNDPIALYSLNVPVDVNMYGKAISLLEPGSTSFFSDIVGIADFGVGNGHDYRLAFSSDTETAPTPYGEQGNITQIEPLGWLDVTDFLSLEWQQAGYRAGFMSAPDAGATGLMLGTALMGMAAFRRKWA